MLVYACGWSYQFFLAGACLLQHRRASIFHDESTAGAEISARVKSLISASRLGETMQIPKEHVGLSSAKLEFHHFWTFISAFIAVIVR